MSFRDLPLELVTIIVDHFYDDTKSLNLISLVSRPCLAACRTHLFKIIRMNTLNPSFNYKCAFWSAFLKRSSAVLPYVRELELGPPVFQLCARDFTMGSSHWVDVVDSGLPSIHNECVELILSGATNVHRVALRFEYQSWKNFSPSFQRAVVDLIRRDSVSSLTIEDIVAFPIQILSHCRRLRDLSLFCVDSTPDEFNPMQPPRSVDLKDVPKGCLQSLTLFESDSCITSLERVLSAPESYLAASNLQRLSVNMTGSDGQLALMELSNSARSITTLELRYKYCDLTGFTSLRTLFISISYYSCYRPLQALALFFTKFRSTSHLTELSILLRLEVENSDRSSPSSQELTRICSSKDWQLVQQSLVLSHSFLLLNKLNIVFRPRDVATITSDYLNLSLHLCLLQSMPNLYALTNPTIKIHDGA
ncbi:hypothetical protein CVT25_003680 [Psilocybe cyanescens]|uniref:F-box domain-containing protein n=1 Tax=Psilocybe cyanescens TaxID=93625 RepID=A0A409WP62_PSICY|nr:hypothetical protein CVT25_003680 [Psilocybe cyanescens]